MNTIQLKIPNANGHQLNARLELPVHQKVSNYVIFAHCFTCSSNLNAVRNISKALTHEGFGVLRFDFTGLGRSEGSFAESHFKANINDIISVHEYMKDNYTAPSLLVGHSLGGAAVLVAGSRLSEIKAVATIGAPASATHVAQHFSHGIKDVESKGEVEVNIGGRPFKINQDFLEGFTKIDIMAEVKQLRKPLLVLHAPFDKTVGVENAQEIFVNAHHPKSFVSLDGADHLLSQQSDSLYAGGIISSWSKRFLKQIDQVELKTEGAQLVGHLNLIEDKFTTTIQTQKHTFIADEPESVGGNDFGPGPYELLTASLAACTVMTLKMYAQRKKWDLQEVYVYLTHEKKRLEASDTSHAEDGKPRIVDHISKKLKFVGDLTEEQKERLVEISKRCPIHRTLLGEIVIEA